MIQDRVMETSTSTGTGTFTLAGAVTGYDAFPNGSFFYTIEAVDGNGNPSGEWECGYGSVTSSVLTRTSVHSSSNSDAAVNFSAGTKRVFVSATSRYLLPLPLTFNFADEADVLFYADVAMTLTQQATSGTLTIAYEKSTAAAPSTFSSTSSPISLEAGAWLKVSATGVTAPAAVHLKRTA